MSRPLREYFWHVDASDVFDYGIGKPVLDYLSPAALGLKPVDWTIFNPPFRLGLEFIQQTQRKSSFGCAAIVRTAFLEGGKRYQDLFKHNAPTMIAQFAERVIMTKGVVRDPSKPYWDDVSEKMKRPSTATSYTWLVWVKGAPRQPLQWIPPCRVQLERAGDYV